MEQLQIRGALELVRDRVVSTLVRLARLAVEHQALVMTGRSHNVAAQATTLGKRFASAADELLVAYERLEELLARYPLRGIKGPVGTAQDMLDLLGDELDQQRRGRAHRHASAFAYCAGSCARSRPASIGKPSASRDAMYALATSRDSARMRPM